MIPDSTTYSADPPTAEQAYLFRHAVVRDAAYSLQLPGERALLHSFALAILEHEPEAEAGLAADLADHAREAATLAGAGTGERELHYLRLAAAHAGRVYEPARQVELCRRVADHPLCDPITAAEHLADAGFTLLNLGRAAEAEEVVTRAISLAEAGGNRALQLSLRRQLMDVYKLTGRRAVMYAEMPGIVHELRKLGDSLALSQAELDLEDVFLQRGDREGALACAQRGLEIARRLGNRLQEAQALARVSYRLHRMGRSEEGEQQALLGLEICRADDDLYSEATLANALGVIYVETRRIEFARKHYTRAMALAAATGRFHAEAIMARNLGNLEYYFGGNLTTAAGLYRQARDFFAEAGDLEGTSSAGRALGSTVLALGDAGLALECFQDATKWARLAGDGQAEAYARRFAAQARRVIDPGRGEIAELVDVAALSARSSASQILEQTLHDIARELFERGMLTATQRILQLADMRHRDMEPGRAMPSLRIRVGLLVGDASEADALIASEEKVWGGAETPQHNVSRVLINRLRLSLAEAVGDFGTAHLAQGWRGADVPGQILQTMLSLAQGNAGQYAHVGRAVEDAKGVMAELEAAVRESRPALLFRAHLPGQLTPACRAALLDQLRHTSPETHARLSRENPALFEAMQGEPPDWRAEDLPGGELARLEAGLAPQA
ncbi:MAG: hypothetical protein H6841_08810 [Planctomycetes bacterium]|nr:hypothetical protein [Planctomycetota bacterium]MCB9936145.1 hypothetical protein [Planctomycetota bacterium]